MAKPQRRKYDRARVQAELEGKTSYLGAPCQKNPEHIRVDGTTLRDTVKYRCLLCRKDQRRQRNARRREQYSQQHD
jgi:hypothetical protein